LRLERRGLTARPFWEPRDFPAERTVSVHGAEGHPGSDEELARIASELQNAPFDLSEGPLVDIHWYPGDVEHGELVLRFHHALSDGLGSLALLRDLCRCYGDTVIEPEPSESAADLEPGFSPKLFFGLVRFLWRAGLRTRFAIPDHVYDGPKAPRGRFACAVRVLPAERSDSLSASARRMNVSVNSLLAASCARAIARLKEEGGRRCGTLRIMINQRSGRGGSFANHSTALPVWIRPLDRDDPMHLARAIHGQIRDGFRNRIGAAIRMLGGALRLPAPIPRLLLSSANRRTGSDSFIISNLGTLPDFELGEARFVRAFGFARPPNGVGALLISATTGEAMTLALSYLAGGLTGSGAERLLELIESELLGFSAVEAEAPW
jgi:hypothetical protein